VKEVSDFYIETKVRSLENMLILERQTDSIDENSTGYYRVAVATIPLI
jgi:hypothetical protein